jgi:aspartate 1-decarboxylase
MIRTIRAKLHGLRVTGSDLHYHGSITLDPDHCAAAGLYPTEFVEVWNKNSGARLSTYIIFGPPGSRCCVLNGAAARTCQVGDELIIAAAHDIAPEDIHAARPKVVTFLPNNEIDQILAYEVFKSADRAHDFRIVDLRADRGASGPASVHNYPMVDIGAIRADLKAKGLTDDETGAFITRHLTR